MSHDMFIQEPDLRPSIQTAHMLVDNHLDEWETSDLTLFERPEWHHRGACRRPEHDPSWWFADLFQEGSPTIKAKQICNNDCPVRVQCLEYAIEHGEKHGVWGGLSERQRRTLRRERQIRVPGHIGHGTDAAYARHIRAGTKPCASCRAAHNRMKEIRNENRQKRETA